MDDTSRQTMSMHTDDDESFVASPILMGRFHCLFYGAEQKMLSVIMKLAPPISHNIWTLSIHMLHKPKDVQIDLPLSTPI